MRVLGATILLGVCLTMPFTASSSSPPSPPASTPTKSTSTGTTTKSQTTTELTTNGPTTTGGPTTSTVSSSPESTTNASIETLGTVTMDTEIMTTDIDVTTSKTTAKATTIPPTTTVPSGIGTWTVLGGEKNLTCMKMVFEGSIDVKDKADPIPVPPTASAQSSVCSGDNSDFKLEFVDKEGSDVFLQLSFVMQDKAKSYLWNASVTYIEHGASMTALTASKVQIRFETPAGSSFQCDTQTVPIGSKFNLTLTDIRLQPFAEYADNDFGSPFSCIAPKKGTDPAVIVGLVLGSVIVILLVAVCALYRKKQGPGRGYNNFS